MMTIFDSALLAAVGLLFLYLAVLSGLALLHRDLPLNQSNRYYRFAVVVPAHNEISGIARTLRSILQVEYPHLWFDVVVIADNCTDKTAEIARGMGAIVYERYNENLRGKGHALRWCFNRLLNERPAYDAFLVVDADTSISSNILTALSSHLEEGEKVIQCADVVQPQQGAWSSEITRLGFSLYNVARPLGRSVLGLSAGLRGNGMCFSREVLQAIPWQAYSRAEDLEYSLMLLLHGYNVAFAPETRVLAMMPSDPKNAETQRARWETGRFPLVKAYAGKLLATAMRRGSFVTLDAFIDLVMPPIVNLFVFSLCMVMLHLFVVAVGHGAALLHLYGWMVAAALGAAHVLLGLIAAKADRDIYRALLHAPRYILWKLVLYTKLVVKGQTGAWVRTTREDGVLQTHDGVVSEEWDCVQRESLRDTNDRTVHPSSVENGVRHA